MADRETIFSAKEFEWVFPDGQLRNATVYAGWRYRRVDDHVYVCAFLRIVNGPPRGGTTEWIVSEMRVE